MSRFASAAFLAASAFQDMNDLVGLPMIDHSRRVMESVEGLGESYAIVAILHDVIEDTEYTLPEVVSKCELTAHETGALALVTRMEGQTYREYIEAIEENVEWESGQIARAVKVADLHDNLTRKSPDWLRGIDKRHRMALQILDGGDAVWQTMEKARQT